jgi:hypothetical protein
VQICYLRPIRFSEEHDNHQASRTSVLSHDGTRSPKTPDDILRCRRNVSTAQHPDELIGLSRSLGIWPHLHQCLLCDSEQTQIEGLRPVRGMRREDMQSRASRKWFVKETV